MKEVKVNYGGYSGKDDEIDMATRSMLQIMLEFSTLVRVPASDVTLGKATPGSVDAQADQPQGAAAMKVMSGDAAPKDAFVSVQYGGRWFWIADTDIQSKSTFGDPDAAFLDRRDRRQRVGARRHRSREPVTAAPQ